MDKDFGLDILPQKEGIQVLAELIHEKRLIPVFGSGFTAGSEAYHGKVLDGPSATIKMKEMLVGQFDKLTWEVLADKDFTDTAELFISMIEREKRTGFFRDYFTDVKLGQLQKDFLNLDWPYAYTLNVDDGIEGSSDFKAVLPYRKLNDIGGHKKTFKTLYKLHGDAFSEIAYADDVNIVFSQKQYLTAITRKENKDILNNLKADIVENNMIFIGCSLENELDLKYLFNISEKRAHTKKIVLRRQAPLWLEANNLKMNYGINTVILVDNYEEFYSNLIREVKDKESEGEPWHYRFKNPRICVNESQEDTINYLSGIPIFDEKENCFYKGGMHVLRNCVSEIEEQLENTECVIVKGRRFSGKTFLMLSLCERRKDYPVYFFPSTTSVDEQTLFAMMEREHKSYFIFDSNSISKDCYRLLTNSHDVIIKNKNKIVIAVNSSDNSIMESLDASLVELPSNFTGNELKENKRKADRYGIISRIYKNTNMDYLEKISHNQKINLKSINNYTNKLSQNELIMMLLLAAEDKLFVGDIIALDISPSDIDRFKRKFPVLIEELQVDRDERSNHSSTKLVHNSKAVLIRLLNQNDDEKIVDCIVRIVERLKDDEQRKRIYIEVTLFDTLNQLFGGNSGAGNLIFKLYNRLKDILSDSPNYWLQRAKSIYHLKSKDLNSLIEAYNYSIKVYFDAHEPLRSKAALTTSLISCLIAELLDEGSSERLDYTKKAVELGCYAVNSAYYRVNPRYLNSDLKSGRKKNSYALLKNVCEDCIKSCVDEEILEQTQNLLDIINDVKKQFGNRYNGSVKVALE